MRSGLAEGDRKIAEFPFHTRAFGWGMIASSTKLSSESYEKYELKERGGVITATMREEAAWLSTMTGTGTGTRAVRLSWWYDTANDWNTQDEKRGTQVSQGSSPSPSIGYRLHV